MKNQIVVLLVILSLACMVSLSSYAASRSVGGGSSDVCAHKKGAAWVQNIGSTAPEYPYKCTSSTTGTVYYCGGYVIPNAQNVIFVHISSGQIASSYSALSPSLCAMVYNTL